MANSDVPSSFLSSTKRHLPSLLSLAAPMMLTQIIQSLYSSSTTIFVGHLNDPFLIGSVVLGSMLCNISGNSLIYGMLQSLGK